jgi:hypothetical protein
VDHSDNYFVINPAGVERMIQAAAADALGALAVSVGRPLPQSAS